VLEVCTDVPRQHWEARVLIFDRVAEAVADAVAEEIAYDPEYDARLTGCDLRTLGPEPGLGAHLVYLADAPATPIRPPRPTSRRRTTMNVRDGMNPIVVTAGPEHTLREAARRMTARGVGAAVIIDDELPGPCIITERDIVRCWTADGATCEVVS